MKFRLERLVRIVADRTDVWLTISGGIVTVTFGGEHDYAVYVLSAKEDEAISDLIYELNHGKLRAKERVFV